jgi:hypothetical protein
MSDKEDYNIPDVGMSTELLEGVIDDLSDIKESPRVLSDKVIEGEGEEESSNHSNSNASQNARVKKPLCISSSSFNQSSSS